MRTRCNFRLLQRLMPTFKLRSPMALCASVLILIGGCTSYQPDVPQGTEAYRQSLRVLVQICMPTGFTQSLLSMSQVDRFGDRGEMRSVGSGAEPRIGMSVAGEPIFELFTHSRHVDLVAIIVNVNDAGYTYDITNGKPTVEGWTSWEAPQSQNNHDEMVWYRLAHQRDFKVTLPDREAPKARYRLVRTIDWWNKVPRQHDDRPACQ